MNCGLNSFNIASLKIKNPFILAPLAGISNWPFRKLAVIEGAGLTFSEMVSSVALSYNGKATLKLLENSPEIENPFAVQLFGHDPIRMGLAAKIAVEKGAQIIDLNFACPARKVVNSGNGSALLGDFNKIKEIVQEVRKAISVPLTVKTRPGLSPDKTVIFDLLPIFINEGVDAITLHPRYTSEGFSGSANWDLVGELAEASSIPIIGSGDITTAQEAIERLKNYKVKAVMIGRAAKGNPWIFREALELLNNNKIIEITLEEKLQTAINHATLLGEMVEHKAPFMLRSILMWYTKGLHGSAEFRAKICREENLEKQIGLLKECFYLHQQHTQEN